MRYFLDALICGPAATAEYFVNGACEALANVFCFVSDLETKSKTKAAENKAAETTTTEKTEEKAEIIEFVQAKEKVNSTINAQFSTVDEDLQDNKFTEDQVSNFIDDIVDKVVKNSELNLDSEKDLNDIKLTSLALLLAINKAKYTAKISTEYIKNLDDQVELNTIYKFFTNTKFFTGNVSCIQLNEVITTQLLYDTVITIYETEDFSQNEVMTQILTKTKKRLEKEAISTAVLNDEVDPVTPVVFNQGILGSAFSGKHPKVSKTTEEYIINYISNILPADWVRDNSITLEMSPKQDMIDPNKDTGMAILTVKVFGEVMKTFDIDLDTITGNGYGLGIPAYFPDPQQPNHSIVQILFVYREVPKYHFQCYCKKLLYA